MNFDALVQSLLAILSQNSCLIVVCAVLTSVLTQIVKTVFIPKLKIDLNGKFDPTVLVPVVIGTACSAVMTFAMNRVAFSQESLYAVFLEGLTIAATAMLLFRVVSSFLGKSVKHLKKNEVFSLFYDQLFLFGNFKQKLMKKEISLTQFSKQVQEMAEAAKALYLNGEISAVDKKSHLKTTLAPMTGESNLEVVTNFIHAAMMTLSNDE